MTDLRLADRRASLPFFAVSLLAPLALSACAKKQERPVRPPATVAVAQARRATVPYVIEANGIVTPLQTVAITSQDDGLILTVDFAEGQEVRSGQSLFHLDPRPYQNAYDQAVAVFGRDSATWAYAREESERYKKMLDAKVITPEEGGTQITAAATAEATLKADRANIAQAKFNLENTVIRAPITGKTGSLLVKQGNLVHAGAATPLVIINQVRPIQVRFAIPSAQLGLLLQYGAKGGLPVAAVPGGIAPASPSIDSLAASVMNPINDTQGESGAPVRSGGGSGHGHRGAGSASATDGAGGPPGSTPSAGPNVANGTVAGAGSGNAANMDGGPVGSNASPSGRGTRGRGARGGQTSAQGGAADPVQQGDSGDRMMGKLTFIDNAVDTTTATVQLKAIFDNASGRLWAGQFATTSLHLFDEDSALVVPEQAIVTGQQGSYVYVVDQTDTARQRAVVVERNAGGLAIISSGLRSGENVVTDGQSRLTPDSPVRLRGASDSDSPTGGRRGRGGRGKKGGGASGGGTSGGGSGAGGGG